MSEREIILEGNSDGDTWMVEGFTGPPPDGREVLPVVPKSRAEKAERERDEAYSAIRTHELQLVRAEARCTQLIEERDNWIKTFNRLAALIAKHIRAKDPEAHEFKHWGDETDEALHAGYQRVCEAASVLSPSEVQE